MFPECVTFSCVSSQQLRSEGFPADLLMVNDFAALRRRVANHSSVTQFGGKTSCMWNIKVYPIQPCSSYTSSCSTRHQSTLEEAHSHISTPTATEIEQNVVMRMRFVCFLQRDTQLIIWRGHNWTLSRCRLHSSEHQLLWTSVPTRLNKSAFFLIWLLVLSFNPQLKATGLHLLLWEFILGNANWCGSIRRDVRFKKQHVTDSEWCV